MKKPLKIIFRTNASNQIGLGHLNRCKILYQTMKTMNSNCEFIFIINFEAKNFLENENVIISENFDQKDLEKIIELNPDLVILDSYIVSDEYLSFLSNKNIKTALFDDNNDIHETIITEFLINGNIHAKNLEYSQHKCKNLLLGLEFLIINPKFNTEINDFEKEGILITSGGGDHSEILPKLVESLKNLPIKKKVIIGPSVRKSTIEQIQQCSDKNTILYIAPQDIVSIIDSAELTISASGSMIYEILRRKKPLIVFEYAKNQSLAAKALEEHGILNLGWFENIKFSNLNSIISNYYKNLDYYKKCEMLSQWIDGKGAMRVSEFIYKALT